MDHKLLVDLISVPLFTGIIGYITNWTGVLMLFRPIRFHGFKVPLLKVLFPILPRRIQVLPLIRYDGGLGWQGIVPSRADKMASIAVDKGWPSSAASRTSTASSSRTASPSTWPRSPSSRSARSSTRS